MFFLNFQGGKGQLNECEFYDKKMSEADDDNITFLSEGGEFRSEQGSTAGMYQLQVSTTNFMVYGTWKFHAVFIRARQ